MVQNCATGGLRAQAGTGCLCNVTWVSGDEKVNQIERQRWNDQRWTAAWPKREQLTRTVTPYLLGAAGIREGHRVLDIGSGAGIAALSAASTVGPSGSVTGADISAPLVSHASRRAENEGTSAVRFLVKDVQQESVEGAPFDVAISQFGVMFFDDPRAAFANIRDHVTPGGRLAFACWQSMDQNPWFIGAALAPFVAPPAAPAPGKHPTGPFAFADPDHVGSILADSGWSQVDQVAHRVTALVPQDAIVDEEQMTFMGIAEEARSDALRAVDTHLEPLRRPDGRIEAPLAFHVFTAVN